MICESFSKLYSKNWINKEHQIAIQDESSSITYGELEKEINRITTFLLSLNVLKEDRIFVYESRKKEFLLLILGIMQAGACFIPIGQEINAEEVENCFIENNGKYIFTENVEIRRKLKGKVIEFSNIPSAFYETKEFPNISENQLAYIMFTSGTTGKRKGVMIEHHSVWNLVEALNDSAYCDVAKTLRIGVTASFSFDASLKQIFYSLYYGHTLIIIPERVKRWGREYIGFINEHRIEVIDLTPSTILMIEMDNKRESTTTLDRILVGGEKLTPEIVQKAYQSFGKSINIFNLYGPTECCVDSAVYRVKRQDVFKEKDSISIGFPLKNIYFELKNIDKNGIGEIYISGAAVGRGYVDSNEGFLYDNGERKYRTGDYAYKNGNGFYIVGRLDRQVKIKGVRVELDEIDICIQKMKGVYFSYTILKRKNKRDILISFVESDILTKREILAYLKSKYPEYMIPNRIIVQNNGLKLNDNGKVDRNYYINIYQEYIEKNISFIREENAKL